MARDIVVYRDSDVEHLSPSDWRLRDGAKPLLDEPLGGEGAVREFWSAPATRLGLPLLAAVYEHGFYHGICARASFRPMTPRRGSAGLRSRRCRATPRRPRLRAGAGRPRRAAPWPRARRGRGGSG